MCPDAFRYTVTYNWRICAGASQQTDDPDWWKRSESFVMIKERCHYFSYMHSYSDKCFVFHFFLSFFFFFFLSLETCRNTAVGGGAYSCAGCSNAYGRARRRRAISSGLGQRHMAFAIHVKTNQGEKALRPPFHLVPAL